MPDMLLMSAFKLGDPVQVLILVEADYLSWQTSRLTLRFHSRKPKIGLSEKRLESSPV